MVIIMIIVEHICIAIQDCMIVAIASIHNTIVCMYRQVYSYSTKSHLRAFSDFFFFIFHSVHTQPVVTITSRIIDNPNSTPRTAVGAPLVLPLPVDDIVTCTVVVLVS